MQFVLSSQSDIFIGCGQYDKKGVCCGPSIASVSDISKSFSYIHIFQNYPAPGVHVLGPGA